MLPIYYFKEKNQSLENNANDLQIELNKATNLDECKALIHNFATSNNSTIIAFRADSIIIPELSSPFLILAESGQDSVNFVYRGNMASDGVNMRIISQKIMDPNSPSDLDMISPSLNLQINERNLVVRHQSKESVITKTLTSELIGHISISSTLQPIDEAQKVIISLIPYLMIFSFIIALSPAYIFAKQITNPILKITGTTTSMREMEQGVLSNIRTNDELGELSYNLDSLYLSLCENIENLKLEMNKVAKLEEARTDFMRAAGHELKTPIAALNGILEGMIDNVGIYQNREKYLHECKDQVLNLAKLVNKILMSSELDHIEESIALEDIDIFDIVEEASSMYRILIEKKQLHIIKDEFSFIYNTDYSILLNTLSNLISNAVNYTEPGGKIIISLSEADEKILSIENKSKKIDASLLPKLFDPFFTLDYSRHKSKSGTGLGLYIVKKNLNALKLDFKIENTETGIKFSIIF